MIRTHLLTVVCLHIATRTNTRPVEKALGHDMTDYLRVAINQQGFTIKILKIRIKIYLHNYMILNTRHFDNNTIDNFKGIIIS